MCENHDDEKEQESLFALLRELKEKYLIFTNDDYAILKSI